MSKIVNCTHNFYCHIPEMMHFGSDFRLNMQHHRVLEVPKSCSVHKVTVLWCYFKWTNLKYKILQLYGFWWHRRSRYTGYTQMNGAISKGNKKFISHLTRAQRTPSAAANLQVSHALITILQCVHPGSLDTHPHGNQIHPRLGVACPL
jgi:hypothetical protein